MASTANFGLTLTASASRHSSTASMQRNSLSGGACAAIAATLSAMSGWLAVHVAGTRRDQQRVAEVGRQVDQRPVQRIPGRPRLAGLLPPLKVFDRAGRHHAASPAVPLPVPPAPSAVRSSSVSASLRSSVSAFASASAVATNSSAAA